MLHAPMQLDINIKCDSESTSLMYLLINTKNRHYRINFPLTVGFSVRCNNTGRITECIKKFRISTLVDLYDKPRGKFGNT